ncbi:hypothetical protein [Virgibacillus siamensis]|uniref:hypothetical protein n=1 Tax=Virgibacillus siamensis TaxID=480071 RepID=UPI0009878AEB|nr:hypothetical protein [Virgibacillus siamensis]
MDAAQRENSKRHFHMIIGNIGFLLIGLGVIRVMELLDDRLVQGLLLFGFLGLVTYLRFLEEKIVPKKEVILSCIVSITIFIVLSIIILI